MVSIRNDKTVEGEIDRSQSSIDSYWKISDKYKLPKIGAWLQVVSTHDPICATMPDAAF